MSQLPTIISEPESADADTQDGKDGGEKEAETYENVFEYLTKGCYPQRASKAEKSILRRMSKKFQVVDGILHYNGKGQFKVSQRYYWKRISSDVDNWV